VLIVLNTGWYARSAENEKEMSAGGMSMMNDEPKLGRHHKTKDTRKKVKETV
jgi:hypothetical protein